MYNELIYTNTNMLYVYVDIINRGRGGLGNSVPVPVPILTFCHMGIPGPILVTWFYKEYASSVGAG